MVQPLDGQTPATRIGPEDKTVFEMDWAPDDRHLAIMFADSPRSDDNYMFRSLAIIDRQNSALRILARDVGKMVAPRVSPDGRNLIWLGASQKNDATTGTLWTIPLKGGKRSALNKDLEETIYAADWLSRTSLLVTAVRGTRSHLSIRKLSGISRTLSLSKHAPIFLSAHHSSGRYVIAGDTPKRPSALYFGTLKQPQPTLKYDPNPQIRDIHFATQRTYEWTASDGKTLQGVLVEPMPGTPRPAPLILAVHGGPEWQSLDGWVNRYLSPAQLLAQRGYAVLFPNYRGSAGRGAPFAMSDHKDLGGQEFQDHIDAINALATDGLIDSKRVGMMGGSYGGYMSALAATKGSKHFAAAINFAGIANWMSFTGTSDIPYENSITHWDLWCYDKPETCWKASPLAYVAQAKTPLLLVHGENDKRVPIGQAHELHTAFKRFKIPVQLITYPREGHGLREWAHREDFINRALSWFDQYVRKN
jgi:dipeptidyl aminopeptidase/acylaminoacyl peptidase